MRITPYMSRCRFAQRAGEIAALKKRLADLTAGHVEDMNVLHVASGTSSASLS